MFINFVSDSSNMLGCSLLIMQILMNALMEPMIVITHVPIPLVDTHAHVTKDICYTMTVQLAMVRSDAY